MEIKSTSIFKRPARLKKTKQLDADGKPKMVKVTGGWVYRIRYIEFGRPKSLEAKVTLADSIKAREKLKRKAKPQKEIAKGEVTKQDAHFVLDMKRDELLTIGGAGIDGSKMIFDDLAGYALKYLYKPAVIVDGRKYSGTKSLHSAQKIIENLRAFFGKSRIAELTARALFEYKDHRVTQSRKSAKTPEAKAKMIKPSTVNRELTVMRRMMLEALNQGWISKNIFKTSPGQPKVIEPKDARPRTQFLSLEEETKLLEYCQGTRTVPYQRVRRGKVENLTMTVDANNPLLRAMIVLAIDSGMRRGEILKMKWTDINFDDDVIFIPSENTKTGEERRTRLSPRAKAELDRIRFYSKGDRPFPLTSISRSFNTAARLAGLKDLRFHDLRRTCNMRWHVGGLPPALITKMLGNKIMTNLRDYTEVGTNEIRQVNAQLNAEIGVMAQQVAIESDLVN